MSPRPHPRYDDKTERTRTRQSVSRNKLALTICALLVAAGVAGWFSSL